MEAPVAPETKCVFTYRLTDSDMSKFSVSLKQQHFYILVGLLYFTYYEQQLTFWPQNELLHLHHGFLFL